MASDPAEGGAPVQVPKELVAESVRLLETLSAGERESVILWVGVATQTPARVQRIVIPEQRASRDHFEVPLSARLQLITELGRTGETVLVQLHTHPSEAFHSPVDDRLAVPRQTGALSIVVPHFGQDWSGSLWETSVNRHLGRGRWEELDRVSLGQALEVIG